MNILLTVNRKGNIGRDPGFLAVFLFDSTLTTHHPGIGRLYLHYAERRKTYFKAHV
jgi:hypothetical protein